MKDYYGLDRKHTIGRIGKILKKKSAVVSEVYQTWQPFLAHAMSTSTRTIM